MKYHGEFLSYWKNPVDPAVDGYIAAKDFLVTVGDKVEDLTNTPASEVYEPGPNSVICYIVGTQAELNNIEADLNAEGKPTHFCFQKKPVIEELDK